jgi:carbonic anhydrase
MKHGVGMMVLVGFAATAFAAAEPAHWSYEGATGPEHWGELSPENTMCAIGRNQAPIDIAGAMHVSETPLHPRYSQGSAQIVNNGHTVQVDFRPGNTLVVDGVTFGLVQMHFHAPSENTIAGHSFPMEAHFVHADPNGNLLVLAMMFKEGPANRALAKVWSAMPAKEGPAVALPDAITPMQLMPAAMQYYRFSGSLTTPPCSEGVRWLVLETPVSASAAQIHAFEQAVGHHNNRPLQALNGRVVVR